jgi:GT2 family glycosyltransferase
METDSKRIEKILLKRSPLAHPSTLIRKSSLLALKDIYREIYLQAEDHDLWLRLSEVGKLANLHEPLIYYRKHSMQYSHAKQADQAIYSRFAILSHLHRLSGKTPPDNRFISISDWLTTPKGRFEYSKVKVMARLRSSNILSKLKLLFK